MSRDFDVAIVGAGATATVAGALLIARKLSAAGRVAVIGERAMRVRHAEPPAAQPGMREWVPWDLRVFALSRASQRVLELCGVWRALPSELVFPYERMCVWDEGGAPRGRGSLTFDCAELGEPNLGHIVDGNALHEGCVRAAAEAGVAFIEGAVDALETDAHGARIVLHDGRSLGARLVIGADGAQSRARALLGIDTAGHSYDQDALVAHVRTEKPHGNTAWQRFLPTGPLALLPLSDGRSSIVWSVHRDEAARLRALDAADLGAAVGAASGGVLGEVELTTPVASFAIRLQYALDYARPCAVLLGDAAHAVHPLAGQGLNLGLLDCATLVEVLGGGGVEDLGEYRLLRRYERRRRSENLLAATAFDGLERLFSLSGRNLAGLRMAGLEAVGRLPFLRRAFARRALGLAGDVPEFIKRESPSE